jgi:hypothetical protein
MLPACALPRARWRAFHFRRERNLPVEHDETYDPMTKVVMRTLDVFDQKAGRSMP